MTDTVPRTPPRALALLLACLVPGMGQLVLGRTRRGAVLMTVGLLGGPTLLALALAPPGRATLLALLAVAGVTLLALVVGVIDVLVRSPHDGLAEPWSTRGVTAALVGLGLLGLVAGLGAMLWVRAHALEAFEVSSSSMVPTLEPGDRILVEKTMPFDRPLRRGDIVVYEPPGEPEGRRFVKRIVGLPGDRVGAEGHVVPPDHCWVEGDGRESSRDSRAHGEVRLDALVGRALYRYWPVARLGVLTEAAAPPSEGSR